MGSVTWSSWISSHSSVPSTSEFCGNEPSFFCWVSKTHLTARWAAATSPMA
jgi:hypothetical protein